METIRRIYNPIQKDYVTFLKTSAETNGEYTLVEVELAPKGGVGIHFHKTYSEKFDCIEGVVSVQLGSTVHQLSAGQTATAQPNINHRFFNTTDKVCKFKVELRPASRGFEQSLQIGYGLARDGEVRSNGFPKDRHALAWLFDISESNLPGWMSILEFILRRQARTARTKGLDKKLIDKYVTF
ncbi:MAG TPA: cupin domain-containing protein [Cyclobacteriaceae bacterium]|nr:cupin domain-containing protein [Cyclobacteriaceae bacterium]